MRIVINADHHRHDPQSFISRGNIVACPEQPERATRMIAALADGAHQEVPVSDFGLGPISAIHSTDYLQFLQAAHAEWCTLDGTPSEVVPNVHPGRHMSGYADHIVAKAGFHMADTAAPKSATRRFSRSLE